jgi:hypothetical protein
MVLKLFFRCSAISLSLRVTATLLELSLDAVPGAISVIDGGRTELYSTRAFGEELLGGLDYDGDGSADLFVGDLVTSRHDIGGGAHGAGFLLWNAAGLRGRSFSIVDPPPEQVVTTFIGSVDAAIAGDTAMHGDFDADGIDDLAFSSPHADPLGRDGAGTLHVVWGQTRPWPTLIDLRPPFQPPLDELVITEVHGANGQRGGNQPDTLGYSGAQGDVDGDGLVDVITNEMTGDGLTVGTEDVGNLVVMSGVWLACYGL